ncbi:putative type 1 light chain of dynein [Hamiltosporidium tvaerminnensis]|uniref:Putative type 1 light chain of dynein n=2 Tax=Hamiltosporidium TaxID=1176354 RepID=A0A4Q9LQC6_9MICR|nr:hypothetical protein LUQ84_002864 [Hamiltosporidium tvaerminnensis]TBU05334.1 putative type 1 light chain of dynein [Hamiltosporidium tvaerminnensis]TBU09580.1 putative type 1 light chain of dynein [Hamiltosporidium magnivora]TBU09896.1 putative type 1 light chain of dynein [Hamiltosporidium magnivora]TBU20360.1 putative type 1 light chain of dynein [Hamiltosporidium tvaerminnensis]
MAEKEQKTDKSNESTIKNKETSSDKENNKKEENENKEKPQSRIKVVKSLVSENILEFIENLAEKYKDTKKPTMIARNFKDELEKKFGKGWNVIIGGHYFGIVVYEDHFYVEIDIDDNRILLFKSYMPPKVK